MKTAAAHMTERFIVIHAREPVLDHNAHASLMAHCFGPFESYAELEAFEDETPDAFYKFAIPLVGPALEDIVASRHPEES